MPFLNWCGCVVLCCTQDAGEQVCSRNHQIFKGNLIPFRDNICFFNMQLPLHLSAIHECRWFLEEEIVDMPVYRCGICKTFVLMFIIIWSLWNFKTLCSFFLSLTIFRVCIHRTENHVSFQSLTKTFRLLESLCKLSSFTKLFGFSLWEVLPPPPPWGKSLACLCI